jgi:hypothetical protein
MVVGNADDPRSDVGDLVEATATGDSLAIKGRSDRDSEFGESASEHQGPQSVRADNQ